MTSDAVRADRFREVREAARGWAKAGVIGDPTRSQIDGLYPDDRQRLGRGLGILAGVATFLGANALLSAVVMTARPERTAAGILLLVFGAASAMLTEVQVGRLRRANAGAELATALLAAGLVTGAFVLLLDDLDGVFLGIAGVAFAAGAYRWGFATLAAFSSIFSLLAVARLPGGRLWWIGACLAAIALVAPRMQAERLAPAHRRCLRVVFAVALLGLYFAIHYDGVKGGIVESIGDESRPWGRGAVATAAALTAMVPLAILFFGVRRRDKIAIAIGALLVGISLATLRIHWDWLPMWLTLAAGGAACFVAAILVRRFLDGAPAREWRGITADPLFDDERGAAALRVAAVAGTLGAQPGPAADRPFQAGGGESGGGGAQGQF